MDYHLVYVGWADDIAEVYIRRRNRVAGDVYTIVLNDIARDIIAGYGETEEQVMNRVSEYVNDKNNRKEFGYLD